MADKWIILIMEARERKIYFPFRLETAVADTTERSLPAEKPERGKFFAAGTQRNDEMSMKRLFTRGGSRYARSAFIHGITSVCDSPRKLERSRRYLFILLPPDRRFSSFAGRRKFSTLLAKKEKEREEKKKEQGVLVTPNRLIRFIFGSFSNQILTCQFNASRHEQLTRVDSYDFLKN